MLLALTGLVFAQVGVEKNCIDVEIGHLAVDPQYLPYGTTATLTVTLNNTSPFLSGTVEVDVFAPSNLRGMVNVSGTGAFFFDVNQTSNVTLTIQNVGTLSDITNGTFTLQITNAGWMTTDKTTFQLSLGANPSYQNTSKTDTYVNSTVTITCMDQATNQPLEGIAIKLTAPQTDAPASNTTNSTGQCTIDLENYAVEIDATTAKASDPTGAYLAATQSISIQPEHTEVTFYLEKSSIDTLPLVEVVVAIIAVVAISLVSFMVYKKKARKTRAKK
jgi:hypothetical protein